MVISAGPYSNQRGGIEEMCFIELITSDKHIPNDQLHFRENTFLNSNFILLTNTQQNTKLSMTQHLGCPSNSLYIQLSSLAIVSTDVWGFFLNSQGNEQVYHFVNNENLVGDALGALVMKAAISWPTAEQAGPRKRTHYQYMWCQTF